MADTVLAVVVRGLRLVVDLGERAAMEEKPSSRVAGALVLVAVALLPAAVFVGVLVGLLGGLCLGGVGAACALLW